MKRSWFFLALVVILICIGIAWSPLVRAAGPVCAGHGASTPYTDYIDGDGQMVLQGSGSITGCPKPSGPFTLTTSLQHLEGGVWVDKATGSSTRAFAVSYRFARQLAVTLDAVCIPGGWRIHASGDGLTWDGAVATFRPGDSGVCGSYGGGD